MVDTEPTSAPHAAVQRAFSKQAAHYDEDDEANPVLADWREIVYAHVRQFMKPADYILELNAGTGIDALHFVTEGYSVHATDISPGMVGKIQEKIVRSGSPERFSAQICSFETLDALKGQKFDYLFSNFGGLNCCADLSRVTRDLPALLNAGAYITWVIMPTICPWELSGLFRRPQSATRRLKRREVTAQLEGESFPVYYYSLADCKKCFGSEFEFRKSQGLGALSPPPSAESFTKNNPGIYHALRNLDRLATRAFPFNRCADHLIVTFQYKP